MKRLVSLTFVLLLSCATTDEHPIDTVPRDSSDRCQITQYRFEQTYKNDEAGRHSAAHVTALSSCVFGVLAVPPLLLFIPTAYATSHYYDEQQKEELNEQLHSDYCKEPVPFGEI